MIGTSLESFDFYVYAYFAAFFVGPLFFGPLGEVGGTLASFSTIALAFVVRPIGAVIFGHMGDRPGRRAPSRARRSGRRPRAVGDSRLAGSG